MSTNCKHGSGAWTTGILLIAGLAGLAALAWVALAHADNAGDDPMSEVDRRIDALEGSLQRLHDTFDHAVRR